MYLDDIRLDQKSAAKTVRYYGLLPNDVRFESVSIQEKEVMSILVKCPNGHKLKVKDKAAGKKVRCSKCESVFRVPNPNRPKQSSPQNQTSDPWSDQEDADFSAQVADTPLPRLPRHRSRRPSRSTPKTAAWRLPVFLGGGAVLAAVVIAVVYLTLFRKEPSVVQVAAAKSTDVKNNSLDAKQQQAHAADSDESPDTAVSGGEAEPDENGPTRTVVVEVPEVEVPIDEEPVAEEPEEVAETQPTPAAPATKKGLQKKLSLSYDKPFGLFSPDDVEPLFVTLELTGEEAEQATAYGMLRIKPLRDNKGKLLKPLKSKFSFKDPSREFVGLDGFSKNEGKLKIHMMYAPPSKEAAQLPVFEGSLQLMTGGRRDEIVQQGILKKLGKKLVNPALSNVGLKVAVRRLRKSDKLVALDVSKRKSAIVVEIDGPTDIVRGVNLLDGNGKYLSAEPGGLESNRATHTTVLAPEKELPADTQLKLFLLSGQKPLTVPFKFENVALNAGGKTKLQKPGTHGGFFSFAFSPDGKTLAGGTGTIRDGNSGKLLGGGEVLIWNGGTGKIMKTLGGHGETVNWLAFSSDGKTLASASKKNGVFKIWNIPSGRKKQTWKAPIAAGQWQSLLLAPNGNSIVATVKNKIKDGQPVSYQTAVWNTKTGKEKWKLPISNSQAMALSPDGNRVVGHIVKVANRKFVSNDLLLCDAETGEVLKTIDLGRNSPRDGLAFLSDGKTVVGLAYRAIQLWDVEAGKLIKTLPLISDESYQKLAVSLDGKTLALPHFMGDRLDLWDLQTGKPKGTRAFEFPNSFRNPAFSSDLTRMVCSQGSQGPVVLDITKLDPLALPKTNKRTTRTTPKAGNKNPNQKKQGN